MLRGINLGKRQLKSAELKAVVESMGFTEVKTILASGNVVFEAGDAKPDALERDLHAALERATGLKSDVHVRNRADLEALVAAIYLDAGYAAARETILRLYGDLPSRLEKTLPADNPKGRLQEFVQPQHRSEEHTSELQSH